MKFNVYFRFSGVAEVDVSTIADAEYNHGITLENVKDNLTFYVFNTSISANDDFYMSSLLVNG